AALGRNRNLTVLDIPAGTVAELVALLQRGMRLQCLIQDGQLQVMNDASAVAVDPLRRMAPAETVN
ncbi:MAG TPA: YaeQ family protein, partial [Rhodanobacter sp.]|nr:YaeQ family protein [Rhodanobacter sp.]